MTTYVSRSAVVADWKCRRSRYYLTEHEGQGIVSSAQNDDLAFGSVLHKGTEMVEREMMGWVPASAWARQELDRLGFNAQMQRLGEGLIAGYGHYLLPRLLKEYKLVGTEWECTVPLAPDPIIHVMVQPDLVVERLGDGIQGYLEKKTTKWGNENWCNAWEHDIQLQLGMEALKLDGINAEFAQIIGFHKAQPHRKTGRLMSPLVWAYITREKGRVKFSSEWQRGWDAFDTSQFESEKWGNGIPGWVRWLEENSQPDLAGCFPVTPPIGYRESQVLAFMRQQGIREVQIAQTRRQPLTGHLLDTIFPQAFSACQIGGYRCAYYDACWRMTNPADSEETAKAILTESARFVRRDPHHDIEAFSLELTEGIE